MKKIEVFNNQNGEYIETWDYNEIIKRFGPAIKAGKKDFNDDDVINYLEQRNNYCMFSIVEK